MSQKNQIRKKLIGAICGLIVSLILIGTGSFAWFTLSTSPEASGISVRMESTGEEYPFELSLNGTTWTTELYVDDLLELYGPLRPISTADGVHWYLPNYDAAGNVVSFRSVQLSAVSNHTSNSDEQEESSNYLIWFDLYVRTRDEDSTFALKLNNPGTDTGDGTIHVDAQETVYGTFVVQAPQWEDGTYTLTNGNDGMNSLRIGFMLFDRTDNTTVSDFFIYEPNADARSSFAVSARYNDLSGIQYVGGSSATVGTYTSQYSNGTFYTTTVPTYDEATGGYVMAPVDTIQQYASSWNSTRLGQTSRTNLDSRCLDSIGTFVDDEGNTITCSELDSMTELSYGQTQKIRVFIWLEGQDVDCWNQIAGGGIYANFEFRGDEVTPDPDPEEDDPEEDDPEEDDPEEDDPEEDDPEEDDPEEDDPEEDDPEEDDPGAGDPEPENSPEPG